MSNEKMLRRFRSARDLFCNVAHILRASRCCVLCLIGILSLNSGANAFYLDYIKSAILNRSYEPRQKEIKISFLDMSETDDVVALTSFASSYLWTTDIRTAINKGESGEMIIVYVENFALPGTGMFKDAFLNEIYSLTKARIQSEGSCTKIIFKAKTADVSRSILYINSKSPYEQRISCIYKHYRSFFGINEAPFNENFPDTFIMDLRIARCYYKANIASSLDMLTLFTKNEC